MSSSASPTQPLIATSAPTATAAARAASLALVVAASVLTFWPTVHNGFLQVAFDDAIVVDTVEIRALDGPNLRAMATRFNHAHYVPLTMLSLALDYRVWGLDPYGYHLTNVALHALTAALACVFLWSIAPSLGAATVAALVFALHPLQMEAVTLAIQRKTLLSGALFFATLIGYQAWRRSGWRGYYAASVAAYAAAALAKPSVMTLPALLWLYDYTFVGAVRWRDTLPFVAIAAGCAAAAMGAHAEVGAVRGWHGGDPLTHVVMMARVAADYVAAVFLPVALAPVYYYRRALALAPLNWLALAALSVLAGWLIARRRQRPWTFFCAAWFAIALLPESNLMPLAQLRADRFLYLPLLGAALWLAVGLERLPALTATPAWASRLPARLAGAAVVAALALATHASAAVWRSDVTAWTRVTELHPWSATAFLLLGHAELAADDPARAEAAYHRALELSPDLADAHLALARLYQARGDEGAADWHAQRFLALMPDSPEGPALLAAMRQRGDS